MDFIEYISSFGQGYTSVDLGSSSSPPSELANPEILGNLDFQKPVDGTPNIQPVMNIPPPTVTNIDSDPTVSLRVDPKPFSPITPPLLTHCATDPVVVESVNKESKTRPCEIVRTVAVETLRRKAPLMIQRVGRLSLEGHAYTYTPANVSPVDRSSWAFDSTDKIEIVRGVRTSSVNTSDVIFLPSLVDELNPTESVPHSTSTEAEVQTNIAEPLVASVSTYEAVVIDSIVTQQSETISITPIELEPVPDDSPEALEVVAEIIAGSDSFILESTDAVCIDEVAGTSQEFQVDEGGGEDGGEQPEYQPIEEREYEEPETESPAEFVEAQLLSDSAGTTVTPSESEQPHKPPSAFATFAAVTALVKLQRRIKRRYDQQRADLINSLGL